MKLYLSMALTFMLITGTINAQHVNLGVKGGLNLYNIHNDNGAEYDSKAGFHLGLLGHIHISKKFAIQPELVYSQQGAKYTTSGAETKVDLGYVNIPVMFQYMFENGFRIEAGPQLGIMVNAESETNNVEIDLNDNLAAIDFALGAGLGWIHTPSGFGVDARYNFGLTNINENSSVKASNRGFQLGVFYQFKHK